MESTLIVHVTRSVRGNFESSCTPYVSITHMAQKATSFEYAVPVIISPSRSRVQHLPCVFVTCMFVNWFQDGHVEFPLLPSQSADGHVRLVPSTNMYPVQVWSCQTCTRVRGGGARARPPRDNPRNLALSHAVSPQNNTAYTILLCYYAVRAAPRLRHGSYPEKL